MNTELRRLVPPVLIAAALLLAYAANGVTQELDVELQQARIRLLESYQRYNPRYANMPPLQAYAQLASDRQTAFDAAVRALFQPLTDRNGTMNARPIDRIRAVHAIWGVRPVKKEGRWQFRLSLDVDAALWALLEQSLEFSGDDGSGHVLRALPVGADDNPAFTAFQVVDSGVRTHRQKKPYPEIQLSYIAATPSIGEMDIDFDSWTIFDYKCHNQPSNSDSGSIMPGHSHPDMFNIRYNFFKARFDPTWQGQRHCEDAY